MCRCGNHVSGRPDTVLSQNAVRCPQSGQGPGRSRILFPLQENVEFGGGPSLVFQRSDHHRFQFPFEHRPFRETLGEQIDGMGGTGIDAEPASIDAQRRIDAAVFGGRGTGGTNKQAKTILRTQFCIANGKHCLDLPADLNLTHSSSQSFWFDSSQKKRHSMHRPDTDFRPRRTEDPA